MKILLALMLCATTAVTGAAGNAPDPNALQLMQKVVARSESARQQAKLSFTLISKGGQRQQREANAYAETQGKARKLAIYFESPRAIRGSGFLSWSMQAGDDQWLYLPALRRSRRIPGRERGGVFLGTDFSYADIQSFGKLVLADYQLGSSKPLAGGLVEIEGAPASAELAAELGYARIRWQIDPKRAFILRSEFFDAAGALIKRIRLEEIEQIEAVWTAKLIVAENLRSGNRTELRFADIDNSATFDTDLLTPAGLERGL